MYLILAELVKDRGQYRTNNLEFVSVGFRIGSRLVGIDHLACIRDKSRNLRIRHP